MKGVDDRARESMAEKHRREQQLRRATFSGYLMCSSASSTIESTSIPIVIDGDRATMSARRESSSSSNGSQNQAQPLTTIANSTLLTSTNIGGKSESNNTTTYNINGTIIEDELLDRASVSDRSSSIFCGDSAQAKMVREQSSHSRKIDKYLSDEMRQFARTRKLLLLG